MKRHLLLSSVLFTAAAFADAPPPAPFKQSEILPEGKYPAAYNAPAQVKLVNSEGKWLPDLFLDVSFIYYRADEDGLDIGTSAGLASPSGTGFVVVGTSNSKTAFQDQEYKPGFKVGIGGRFCEWTLSGEYTWFRSTTSTTRTAPSPDLAGATGVWVLNDWYQQLSSVGQAISASSFKSKWHLAMDLADFMLSRAIYQGRQLIVTPSFGIRAAWIRQNVNVGIDIPIDVIASQRSSVTTSSNSSHSWALGPRAALEADVLLGMGFRLQGDVAASLLFTRYTNVTHSEGVASTTSIPATLGSKYSDYNCLRPAAEVGVGFGWGTYFCGQKYHFDFAATYDFMIFWNQNMIRHLLDSTNAGVGGAPGNLDLQGLTLTARFDF